MSIKNPSPASGSLGYNVYSFLASQSGVANPSITVLGTNSIGAIVWTRSGIGFYQGVLAGAFPANKTFCFPGQSILTSGSSPDVYFFEIARVDDNTIEIDSVNILSSATQDDLLFNTPFEIRVYP